MKKDDFYEEDDGRTIADMSGIERQPTFLTASAATFPRPTRPVRTTARGKALPVS